MARLVSTRFVPRDLMQMSGAYGWIPPRGLDEEVYSSDASSELPKLSQKRRLPPTDSLNEHLKQLNRERVRRHRAKKKLLQK